MCIRDRVGPETLGRILNVIGEPVDERGPVNTNRRAPIHRSAPEFIDQSTEAEILVTGIKVVDLLAPYAKGGKVGLFGGAGVGKTVIIMELILSLIHISEPTRLLSISYAVFCLKKKKQNKTHTTPHR